MDNRKLTVLLLVVVMSCGVIFMSIKKESTPSLPEAIAFMKKELIIDDAQLIVTPVYKPGKTISKLRMKMVLTSYMNPDILSLEFNDYAVLEIGKKLIQSDEWKVIETNSDQIVAELIFKVPSSELMRDFSLKIFTLTDHEIHWD